MIRFAFTAFLLGILGISIPVILHLIRKKPSEVTPFPAFRFLHKNFAAKQTRNNLRKWIILALRCLVFSLISLAFAWPYIPTFPEKPESATVLLWDNSFSMGAKSYSDEMISMARKVIRKADKSNPLLLGLVSGRTSWSPGFSGDEKKLEEFFRKNTPGEGSSSFGEAIFQADSRLREMPSKDKRIVLLTDWQKLPWRNVSFNRKLSPCVKILVIRPEKPGFRNLAIASVRSLNAFTREKQKIPLEVQLKNYSNESLDGKLNVYRGNRLIFSRDSKLKAGESATEILSFPTDKFEQTPARAEWTGNDDIKIDNVRFFSLTPTKLPLLLINGKSKGFDFVRLCYEISSESRIARIKPFNEKDIAAADFIILRKALPLDSPGSKKLINAIKEGKTVFVIWDNSTAMRNFLLHFGIKASLLSEKRTEHFGSIDFKHPVFKRYTELKTGAFFDIAFFSPPKIKLPEGAQIIAEFSDASPAMIELKTGKGKLIFIASSLDRKSSNWVLYPSFLPFMRELLKYGRTADKAQKSVAVDSSVTIPKGSQACDIDHKTVISSGRAFTPVKTGNYIISDGKNSDIISVNVPSEESRSQLLSESFSAAKLESKEKIPHKIAAPVNLPLEGDKTFWRIILAIAALLAVSELLLANRTAL